MLTFNCVLVPVDFWMRFYESYEVTACALCYNAGNWVIMIFMMSFGYKLNQEKLIVSSLFVWLASLVVIPLIYLAISNSVTRSIITLIPVLLCGLANGAYLPCVLDIGSRIDVINAQAIFAGNGLAGVIP